MRRQKDSKCGQLIGKWWLQEQKMKGGYLQGNGGSQEIFLTMKENRKYLNSGKSSGRERNSRSPRKPEGIGCKIQIEPQAATGKGLVL